MRKLYFAVTVVTAAFFGGLGAAPSRAAESIGERLFYHRVEILFPERHSYNLSGIPESVRAVPLHGDDGRLTNILTADDPIAQSETNIKLARFVITYQFQLLWLETGIRLNFEGPPSKASRPHQNQFGGTSRGEGMSLRYYEINRKNKFMPSFVLGAHTPLFPRYSDFAIQLAGGAELDPIGDQLVIEAGWDRFNSDEKWRRFKIGKLHEHKIFFRIDMFPKENRYTVFLEASRLRSSFKPTRDFENLSFKGNGNDVIFAFGCAGTF